MTTNDHVVREKIIEEKPIEAEDIEQSLSDKVKQWVTTTATPFSTTEVYRELKLTTRKDKKAVVVILLRLIKEGGLEKVPTSKGCLKCMEYGGIPF